jgi:hypothetical protein
MSGAVAAIDVITANHHASKLLSDVVHLVGSLGTAE